MDNQHITIYDPPSGWQFGFPKQYKPRPGESLEQTLIRDGYPPKMANQLQKHCRFWYHEGDEDVSSSNSQE